MKAFVTVINDYGEVVEKDKMITPIDEFIYNDPKDIIVTKKTVFRFSVTEALNKYEVIK